MPILPQFSPYQNWFSSPNPTWMSYVLIITNELNGQTEIINRLFSSVEGAQQYVNENHLVLQKIITETEYHVMLQNYQNQKLMRQYYPRPQQQNQQTQTMLHEEPEEPEPLLQQRPVKPVGIIFRPRFAQNLRFNPLFVGRRKVR